MIKWTHSLYVLVLWVFNIWFDMCVCVIKCVAKRAILFVRQQSVGKSNKISHTGGGLTKKSIYKKKKKRQ